MNQKEILETLELAQTVLGQWLRYRQFYLKAISEEPIGLEEEGEFRETTSALAQNVRKLSQRVEEKRMPMRSSEISAQLKTTISISHIRNMPEADRKSFYREWHQSMVYLSRTVGVFKFQSEGYRPPDPKGKKGAKGSNKVMIGVGIAVGLLVLVGVIFGILSFVGIL